MTTTTTAARSSVLAGTRAQLDRLFASIGQGFNAYLESQGRTEEIERLSSKSDKQLAEMGLRREDIPRYVFRDLIHI
jgi:uncharacterized protein YjiS (DUF1127 family)